MHTHTTPTALYSSNVACLENISRRCCLFFLCSFLKFLFMVFFFLTTFCHNQRICARFSDKILLLFVLGVYELIAENRIVSSFNLRFFSSLRHSLIRTHKRFETVVNQMTCINRLRLKFSFIVCLFVCCSNDE